VDAPGDLTPEPEDAAADNQGAEGETHAAPDGPPSTGGEAAPEPREDLADYPMPADVPPELAARIDLLAPERPPYVQTEADRERWAVCARTGAAIAIDQGGDALNDRELAQTAWHLARSMYRQRDELPTGEPDVAPEAQAA